MTNHIKNVLVRARQIIADPAHWTQDCLAKDAAGAQLRSALNRGAVCYCALGALHVAIQGEVKAFPRVYSETWSIAGDVTKYHLANAAIQTLLMTITVETPFDRIDNFNDSVSTTHGDVLAMFDEAIAKQPD